MVALPDSVVRLAMFGGGPRLIRDEYKLGRPDAGWYQIRNALKAYGHAQLTDFGPFNAAYAALTEKLRPQVYELGFLPQ